VQGPVLIAPEFLESGYTGSPQFQRANEKKEGSVLSTLVNPEKTKKRTPARVQKLLGDLYLLLGRLNLAFGWYRLFT
jgi:hypothetical protein